MGFNYIAYYSRSLQVQNPQTSNGGGEFVDPLVEICTKYCLENLPQTLLIERPKRPREEESTSEDDEGSSSFEDEAEEVSQPILSKATVLKKRCKYKINPTVRLPQEICENLLNFLDGDAPDFPRIVKPLFTSVENLPLNKVNIRSSKEATDTVLGVLMKHMPVELDIHHCPKLTKHSLDIINKYGKNLQTLVIGDSVQILPLVIPMEFFDDATAIVDAMESMDDGIYPLSTLNHGIINTPKLLKLVIWNLNSGSLQLTMSRRRSCTSRQEDFLHLDYWEVLTRDFIETITYLDLGGCAFENFEFLAEAKDSLHYLSLYNVDIRSSKLNDVLDVVLQLTNLRHLDISQSNDAHGSAFFQNPNEFLTSLVSSLPHLKSLDISGTNLAGTGSFTEEKLVGMSRLEDDPKCDIPGLASRVKNPLEFLGLYNTKHDAAHRHHIPAKAISGDANPMQIHRACQAYLERPEILQDVLNDIFHLLRAHEIEKHSDDMYHCLSLILKAMNKHPDAKHVQISGSASLFYIAKTELQDKPEDTLDDSLDGDNGRRKKHGMSIRLKRYFLGTLVNGMSLHKTDPTMMRNGCLTICHFQIPQDVLFIYDKLVRLLLDILAYPPGIRTPHEEFVERIAIYLLNSLACQVDGPLKKLIGKELGAIQKMLWLIEDRLKRNDCDDVMEIAWSTMWNVTDETPANCENFLDGKGMALFLGCLSAFPNRPELLRNMMGLLGNVAEVSFLRPQLMTKEFISVFYGLLDSTQDNIEVSYNAAGVLAHVLSDGEAAWTIQNLERRLVLDSMKRNITRWNINSPRNINYRSFEPILRLLKVQHTTECRLWGAWALANLTRVYPKKYISLLKKEGGMSMLSDVEEELKNKGIDTENAAALDSALCSSEMLLQKYIQVTKENVKNFEKDGRIDVQMYLEG